MARLVTAMGALFTSFDQCMFGAESVKPTVLLASPAAPPLAEYTISNR